MLACQQLVHDDPEGEQIGRFGGGLAQKDFGSHISQGSREGVVAFAQVLAHDGQSKIHHFDLPRHEKNIVGLEVAVDDAAPMQIGEGAEELDDEFDLFGQGTAVASGQNGGGLLE